MAFLCHKWLVCIVTLDNVTLCNTVNVYKPRIHAEVDFD